MPNIDFRNIIPRNGSKENAFEELCCQLAHKYIQNEAEFTRLHGAGGDGGVECFAEYINGSLIGWQAKYVFSPQSLITQATRSLKTAVKIHPKLKEYIICFPFDVTGPTGRSRNSGYQKLSSWKKAQEQKIKKTGKSFSIKLWPAAELRKLLMDYDSTGGIREYLFNDKIFTAQWFNDHVTQAIKTAGPRYTPALNIQTNLYKWFNSFGRTTEWSDEFQRKIEKFHQHQLEFISAVERKGSSSSLSPEWPEKLRDKSQKIVANLQIIETEWKKIQYNENFELYEAAFIHTRGIIEILRELESELVDDLSAKHGKHAANSISFRHYMAEYMVSFPAANLDTTRELITSIEDTVRWLSVPSCSLAHEKLFVLSGAAGSGKTHGVCDAAKQRLEKKLLTIITYGHQYRGEPNPWTRFAEILGLGSSFEIDRLLDALNSAGEASRYPLIIIIDALNETRPLTYWRENLTSFIQAVIKRPYLRLCITCRSSFVSHCLPDEFSQKVIEHKGFTGIEWNACKTYFNFYDIEAPISPILPQEYSNPLYLKLVCETLQSKGLHEIPIGWKGISSAIEAFLEENERKFASEHGISVGAKIVTGSLLAIIHEIAVLQTSAVTWSQAERIISAKKPQSIGMGVLQWLVNAELLEEEYPNPLSLEDEATVRPAFERLGDFLVAKALLDKYKDRRIKDLCSKKGSFHKLWKNEEAWERNNGVIQALSVLVPEYYPGVELSEIVNDVEVPSRLVQTTLQSLPSRDPHTYSIVTEQLLRRCINNQKFSFVALDMILATAWQSSLIDALWFNKYLGEYEIAQRDAFWCFYLHDRYETEGIVKRLIDAAFEMTLENVDADICERWAILLLWFTGSPDRRIKDHSSRAVVEIFKAKPSIILSVLSIIIEGNDDEIRERALLCSYGALLIVGQPEIIHQISDMIYHKYRNKPADFNNALIRDHMRSICELASELNVLSKQSYVKIFNAKIEGRWKYRKISKGKIQQLGKIAHFYPDEFISDFYKYSMNCLSPWMKAYPKQRMGEWILQRMIHTFSYGIPDIPRYDWLMLKKYGGGRDKPVWAERIGKKYQWISLYQLASRLFDHCPTSHDSVEIDKTPPAMILLEERTFDPTLFVKGSEKETDLPSWWMPGSVNFNLDNTTRYGKWVTQKNDMPSLESHLQIKRYYNQNWLMLNGFASWSARKKVTVEKEPYREVWMHIQSYLVDKDHLSMAFESIHRRNFFGRWMPEEASWLYGFAGEYPWAAAFNRDNSEWEGYGDYRDTLAKLFTPTTSRVGVEWEYDASISRSFHMVVPAKIFFSLKDLWWNGENGYRLKNGRTIFMDPSVTESGFQSLIADADDLMGRLEKLNMSIVWTMLGEKQIVGGDYRSCPRRTFSQIASLNNDGSVKYGKIEVFKDYSQDTHPTFHTREKVKSKEMINTYKSSKSHKSLK